MPNHHQQNDPAEFKPDDDIDKVLGSANPNPTRAGCPPRDVLIGLARRERPIGDPAYEHLTKCSPCYREFRGFQETFARTRRTSKLRWLAGTAAVLVAGTVTWLVLRPREAPSVPPTAAPAQEQPQLTAQRAEVDLRKFVVARSEQERAAQQPVALTRDRLNLTILLPVGSEAGAYEIQVLDSELRSKASASANAEILNYVTTLQTTLDLRSLPAGAYQLAIRRQGEEWHLFPARVK